MSYNFNEIEPIITQAMQAWLERDLDRLRGLLTESRPPMVASYEREPLEVAYVVARVLYALPGHARLSEHQKNNVEARFRWAEAETGAFVAWVAEELKR